MTLHFTYEGGSVEIGGGRRKTGKGFKFKYCEEQAEDMFGSLSRSPMSNDRTRRPTE